MKDFERSMQDMVATFIENVQTSLAQCRELENIHHEKMMEIAIITLEKVIKNELDDEISEDLRMVGISNTRMWHMKYISIGKWYQSKPHV